MNRAMALPDPADCARLAELEEAFDAFLAAAIAAPDRPRARWNPAWTDAATLSALADRVIYHGIAGLLISDAGTMREWPAAVASRVHEQALAQAMWELRHKLVIRALLDALADAGVSAVLLKGTPLAYQLYPDSAQRVRGDTDVLISPSDLAPARRVLAAAGFERESASEGLFGDLHAQEIWKLVSTEGHEHAVDLHWQVLNSPFLDGTMPRAECTHETVAIPALGPNAHAMSRAWMQFVSDSFKSMRMSEVKDFTVTSSGFCSLTGGLVVCFAIVFDFSATRLFSTRAASQDIFS